MASTPGLLGLDGLPQIPANDVDREDDRFAEDDGPDHRTGANFVQDGRILLAFFVEDAIGTVILAVDGLVVSASRQQQGGGQGGRDQGVRFMVCPYV